MSEPSRALDRLMRQHPTPAGESAAYARALAKQRTEAQARLRSRREPVSFSVKV